MFQNALIRKKGVPAMIEVESPRTKKELRKSSAERYGRRNALAAMQRLLQAIHFNGR